MHEMAFEQSTLERPSLFPLRFDYPQSRNYKTHSFIHPRNRLHILNKSAVQTPDIGRLGIINIKKDLASKFETPQKTPSCNRSTKITPSKINNRHAESLLNVQES